eukprot:5886851-Pleurochrysis_carterae.AAC.1
MPSPGAALHRRAHQGQIWTRQHLPGGDATAGQERRCEKGLVIFRERLRHLRKALLSRLFQDYHGFQGGVAAMAAAWHDARTAGRYHHVRCASVVHQSEGRPLWRSHQL